MRTKVRRRLVVEILRRVRTPLVWCLFMIVRLLIFIANLLIVLRVRELVRVLLT